MGLLGPILAVLVLASPVDTEPATLTMAVRLRSAPAAGAAPVGSAAAGEKVQVELRPMDGFVRVTTASGLAGYVPIDVVELAPATGAPPPAPDLRARPGPPREDATEAMPATGRPERRELWGSAGHTVMWLSVIVGAGVLFANTYATSPKVGATRVGLGLMVIGPVVGWAILPDEHGAPSAR